MDSIDKVREGAAVDSQTIIEMAALFKDGITLDTVSRSHLVAMCKYMGLNAFGSDPYLRYQLRSAIRKLRNDDQSILWEGPESLSTEELKLACEERGMRASGLSRDEYLSQLQHWLDMSVNKNVPLTLLVMSRAFLFTTDAPSADDQTAALQEAVSQVRMYFFFYFIFSLSRLIRADFILRNIYFLHFFFILCYCIAAGRGCDCRCSD